VENASVDGERAPRPGETVRLPEPGESLAAVDEEGANVVYEGPVVEAVFEEIQRASGLLTLEALTGFEVEYPEPVSTTHGGASVYELPPNNQGLIVLEALNVAEEIGVSAHEPEAPPESTPSRKR